MFILKVENEGFVGGGATIACGGLGRDQEVGYYEGIGALKYINMSDDIVENGRDLSFGDLRGRRYLRKGRDVPRLHKEFHKFRDCGRCCQRQ